MAIKGKNSGQLSTLLEINPSSGDGPTISGFPEPSDFEMYYIDEKFRLVIRWYLKLMKSIYVVNDIKQTFNNYIQLVNSLNRAANAETNWINLPLMKACKELIDIYGVMEKSFPEEIQVRNPNLEIVSSQHISSLETLADTINNSFKLSLNDKNLDLAESKRIDIYFFLSCLLKLYFKLNNYEMAKSVEKALKGTRFELPKLDKSLKDKPSAITYLYFSAVIALDDCDFSQSKEKLITALHLISFIDNKSSVKFQIEKILLLLLPLMLFTEGKIPKQFLWKNYEILDYIYNKTLFDAILQGNLNKFEEYFTKFEPFLLSRKLYLLFQNLRQLCQLNLIKKTAKLHSQIDSKTSHIVPISAFKLAFNFSSNYGSNSSKKAYDDNNEIEFILASLISTGKIKGYLSHANQCIVLSKTVPFPPFSN